MPLAAALPSAVAHALFTRIVDYAGLFPPAALPFGAAWARFVAHRALPHAWMLARFVMPAARLPELAEVAAPAPEQPYALSLLGTGGATGAAFLRATADDVEAMTRFEKAHPGLVAPDAFEVRLPLSVQTEGEAAELAARVADVFGQAGYAFPVFFEIGFGPDALALRPRALAAFAAHNARGGLRLGLKLRTGGTTADAFPPPAALAHALVDAHRAGVPFKATAGLHHPVRHYRDEAETRMHGFVNVFGGAVLLYTHHLDAPALTRLLEDEDAAAFHLGPATFGWRDLTASTAEIAAARDAFATSFGSCSFSEPVEDLQEMGWLP